MLLVYFFGKFVIVRFVNIMWIYYDGDNYNYFSHFPSQKKVVFNNVTSMIAEEEKIMQLILEGERPPPIQGDPCDAVAQVKKKKYKK